MTHIRSERKSHSAYINQQDAPDYCAVCEASAILAMAIHHPLTLLHSALHLQSIALTQSLYLSYLSSRADCLASMKSPVDTSSTSSTAISSLPLSFARMEAGVRS